MYDLLIIGSGPAGLSAAVYAERAMLDTAVIEKDFMGSGQIAVTERVDNYLGLYGINGYDLGEKFRRHAEKLGAELVTAEVKKISRKDAAFSLSLSDGRLLESRTVIYAAGASYRRLEIGGGDMQGISYCAVCDGAFYKGKTVCVIGGGDTALGDALYLSKTAKTVYLVHRRESFRANKFLCSRAESAPNIVAVLNAVPVKVEGEGRVSGLTVKQGETEKTIETDGIFAAIGSVPNTGPLKDLCELDKNGYVKAGEDGVTSLPGLFAAGDVRTTALRQVCTAVADGARAAASAENYLSGL